MQVWLSFIKHCVAKPKAECKQTEVFESTTSNMAVLRPQNACLIIGVLLLALICNVACADVKVVKSGVWAG